MSAAARHLANPKLATRDPFGPLEHELKFEVRSFQEAAVEAHLTAFCRPDPRFPDNTVCSIYFDTPDLELVGEKIDSDYLKTKVRLRWYEGGGGPPTAAFLEVKKRVGSRRRKARWPTAWQGAEVRRLGLEDPRLLALETLLYRAGIDVPGPLQPLLTVRYRRRRFLEPFTGTRVALDSAISVAAVHPLRLPQPAPGSRLASGVLEMKGSRDTPPPPLLHLIAGGCFESSFSKYGRCYEALTGTTT